MQHTGVEKDVTVLWCKNEVERDVNAAAARPVCAPPHVAAAEDGGRNQKPVPEQMDAWACAANSTGADALDMSRVHSRRWRFRGRGAEALARHATPTAAQPPNARNAARQASN